jgi:hypothetical protein
VYALYGDFWTHDHNLQWPGMANLVGPLFYAGWQDLYTARTTADPDDLADMFERAPGIPGWVPASPFGPVGDMAGSELEWHEHKFLSMQKQIFDDMAYKHLAYSVGGIGLIRDLADGNQIDLQSASAFENIASGDPTAVSRENASLLEREQHFIVQNDYDEMRNHDGPVGDAFTEALTWTAGNPIPGGHSYVHDYHHNLEVPVPTPVPIPSSTRRCPCRSCRSPTATCPCTTTAGAGRDARRAIPPPPAPVSRWLMSRRRCWPARPSSCSPAAAADRRRRRRSA